MTFIRLPEELVDRIRPMGLRTQCVRLPKADFLELLRQYPMTCYVRDALIRPDQSFDSHERESTRLVFAKGAITRPGSALPARSAE